MWNKLTDIQKNLVVAIAAMVVFIISAATSYSVFASKFGAAPLVGEEAGFQIPVVSTDGTEVGPKTQQCPLNGSMHTQQARDAWSKRRPLAVMIENSTAARPQSGLSYADVVYEAVAEGGITRFMAVFYCDSLPDVQVGPVRSARTYFLDWASEYDALYAHVGGANTPGPANALGQIIDYKMKDLNQFSIDFPTFWRDYQRLKRADGSSVATEHTMYSSTQKLWEVGAKRGWSDPDSKGLKWEENFTPWKFKDTQSGSGATDINISFWAGYKDYDVNWTFDNSCGCYLRKNGGTTHTDMDNGKQLSASNVVVQVVTEKSANDSYPGNVHLLYATNGSKGVASGTAFIFQDGKVIQGKWLKTNRTSREKFVDQTGQEIRFNRGPIWIETVPSAANVKYQ